MDSKKAVMSLAVAVFASLLILNPKTTEAQVTFSRDWNAGKRGAPECAVSIKSAAAISQLILNELRAIASCEMRSVVSQRLAQEEENTPEVFIPQHNG